jgi:hypothetical protein
MVLAFLAFTAFCLAALHGLENIGHQLSWRELRNDGQTLESNRSTQSHARAHLASHCCNLQRDDSSTLVVIAIVVSSLLAAVAFILLEDSGSDSIIKEQFSFQALQAAGLNAHVVNMADGNQQQRRINAVDGVSFADQMRELAEQAQQQAEEARQHMDQVMQQRELLAQLEPVVQQALTQQRQLLRPRQAAPAPQQQPAIRLNMMSAETAGAQQQVSFRGTFASCCMLSIHALWIQQ